MKPELERYAALLRSWQGNLVSRADRARIEQHVEDALVALPLLRRLGVDTLVDVGSGGGLPGLPLALELPTLEVELVESQLRKTAFLSAATEALGLEARVRVHRTRAEEAIPFLGRERAEAASCRALAAVPVATELLSPLVRVGGVLILWTTPLRAEDVPSAASVEALGLAPEPELLASPSALRDDGALLVWRKIAPASARFPRRSGRAAATPLP